MDNPWTNEAVEAALSQLAALRSSKLTKQESMRQVLQAAVRVQEMTLMGLREPSPIISDDGLKVGDWSRDKNNNWRFDAICYD